MLKRACGAPQLRSTGRLQRVVTCQLDCLDHDKAIQEMATARYVAQSAQGTRNSRAVHRLNLVRFDDGSPKASVTTKAVRPKYAVNAATTLAVGVSLVKAR